MTFLRTVRAFLIRDFQVESSYRLAFALQLIGLLVNATLWFFISRFIGGTRPSAELLAQTGGLDYFSFVLVGLMVHRFQEVSLNAYASQIRLEQTTGTLEAMLMAPTRLGHLMLSSAGWSYLLATVQSAFYLLFGVVLFGVVLMPGDLLAAVAAIVLTVLALSGIGIFSAAFVLYFKRGNPINFVIGATTALFGNVFIPAKSLPDALSWVSTFVPASYATEAVRGALLEGASWELLLPDLLALAIFAAILLPAGVAGARFAIARAKREGTLVQY
jgi:ABC-2 type transport system permease protein